MSGIAQNTAIAAGRPLGNRLIRRAANRSPLMFVFIFSAWFAALAWFGPRLLQSLDAAQGPVSSFALHYFVVFIPVAWLYGIYNLSVVLFAIIDRLLKRREHALGCADTPVAVL